MVCLTKLQVKGLNASQVVRLIGMLLLRQQKKKIVQHVRNEMAESIVPLRKKIKDSPTRQGMWKIRALFFTVKTCLCALSEESTLSFSSLSANPFLWRPLIFHMPV